MDFGMALEALKRGKAVARKGWNGKGMFLTYVSGNKIPVSCFTDENIQKHYGKTDVTVNGFICMKAADGTLVIGWLASQTDMLAEDWEIVNPVPMKDEVHYR